MSWFHDLDQIAGMSPSAVGYGAYYLGQLKQRGLPVTEGRVLGPELWRQALDHLQSRQPEQSLSLAHLSLNQSETLRHLSQDWQAALDTTLTSSSLISDDWSCPWPHWVMRPSLWLETRRGPVGPWVLPLHDWLTDRIRAAGPVGQPLQQFWTEALRASSLMVWSQHCQTLLQVGLGTLMLPLYPAQVSGRLTLAADTAYIEAVDGLTWPLRQGEAIAARCQLRRGRPDQAEWQPGYQEQRYCLPLTEAADAQAGMILPAMGQNTSADDAMGLHRIDRFPEELTQVLDGAQLAELLQLAEQIWQALAEAGHPPGSRHCSRPWDGVQIEWALCSAAAGQVQRWVITQAMPWFGTRFSPKPEHRESEAPGPQTRQRVVKEPPPLPQVSVVVRGIGAAAGQVQGKALVAQSPDTLPDPLPPGCIVVLPDLQPDRFLQLTSVAGIVTEQGGATCHAAILAREMGIPAVVGAPQATRLIDPDLQLWLDGERGLVYGMAAALSPELDEAPDRPESASAHRDMPPQALEPAESAQGPPLRTKVMINLSQSKRAQDLAGQAIDGIGLLRSEWLMLEILDQRHPWHWVNQGQTAELQNRLVQALEPIVGAMGDHPVRYRSLDLRSHEWQSLEGSPPVDVNPMLGLRGTLSYTLDPRLFEVELGALATLQQVGYSNLQLMLPFVRSVEEVIACRQHIDHAGLSQHEGFALWMMAEVPSVLFLLSAYARAGVQGVAIGSNDLTQLLLAVDRDQRTMASAYDERHPVVQMALGHIIREARACGMVCSICGQAPVRHPDLIDQLVAWGIDSISVELGAWASTRAAVAKAEQRLPTVHPW